MRDFHGHGESSRGLLGCDAVTPHKMPQLGFDWLRIGSSGGLCGRDVHLSVISFSAASAYAYVGSLILLSIDAVL
jgi:hypothetical protein